MRQHLIVNALPRQLWTETSLEIEPDGVRCLIELPAVPIEKA